MCEIIELKTASFKGWFYRLLASTCFFNIIIAIEINNFVSYNTLLDGEIETRIYYDGVAAKETTVGVRYVSFYLIYLFFCCFAKLRIN